jgi:2-methylcitrate dehydratase PrpD
MTVHEPPTRDSLTTKATYAETLADSCVRLFGAPVAPSVQLAITDLAMDFLGVTLAGSGAPSSEAVFRAISATDEGSKCTLIGRHERASELGAAIINGAAAHAIEWDDVTRESSLHPGASVFPALLAVGETADASGDQIGRAALVAYEVSMWVGEALGPAGTYRRGFHPTALANTFATAVAVSLLLGGDARTVAQSMAIAGSFASGLMEYLSDGALVKRVHPGWSAHAGIVAARLALAGFTGPTTVFEGRFGALHAFSESAPALAGLQNFGIDPRHPRVVEAAVKPYPCCRYNHGAVDCVLDILSKAEVRPEDVVQIDIGIVEGGLPIVAEPTQHKRRPVNVVDAQFSVQYAVAAALIDRQLALPQYAPERIIKPDVRAMMDKTRCYTKPDLNKNYPKEWPTEVAITLGDGRKLTSRVQQPSGDPSNPISPERLRSKFEGLASVALSASATQRLYSLARQLWELPRITKLTSAVRSDGD